MIHLNISERLRVALWETLLTSHRIKIKIHIHDSDEDEVSSFQFGYGSSHLISGAVQYDTTQDVTRSLDLSILDPQRRLKWEPDSPSHGAVFAGYFVSVKYCVLVPVHNLHPRSSLYPAPKLSPGQLHAEGGTWVEIPVFWGPITHVETIGAETQLEAQGKEALALAPHSFAKGFTLPKSTRVDDAIRRTLDRVGERRYDLTELPFKLSHHRVIHPEYEAWKVVKGGQEDANGKRLAGLIQGIGKHPHHIYYDGRGKVRVKRVNKEADMQFGDHWLVEAPTVDWEGLEFINRVVVRGAKPTGKSKKRAYAALTLPRDNPLSPESLSRNGKPAYRTTTIDTDLKTDRECRQRAFHTLLNQGQIGLDASFSCLPCPMLEEGDVIRLKMDDFHVEYPLRQWTLPLTADEPMTVGTNKRVSPRPRIKSGGLHLHGGKH